MNNNEYRKEFNIILNTVINNDYDMKTITKIRKQIKLIIKITLYLHR